MDDTNRLSSASKPRLEIFTLGPFEVRRGDRILSANAERSRMLWDLFKYLLTNREKSIPPAVVMENLWPDHDYADPGSAFRLLVYRLRKLIDDESPGGDRVSHIVHIHNCYRWNSDLDYWLDAEEFENLCREASKCSDQDDEKATALYKQALALYRDDYLSETFYGDWVIPARSYYRRIYLQASLALLELLKKAGRFDEMIKVCEDVFRIENLDEQVHLYFMEALFHAGKIKQARAHYEYVTNLFQRALDVKPSAAMREIYRILQREDTNVELDIKNLQESLSSRQETDEAFCCEPEIFRLLYQLESRRTERSGHSVFLALLTVAQEDYKELPEDALHAAMEQLKRTLLKKLRKGDVISPWNNRSGW